MIYNYNIYIYMIISHKYKLVFIHIPKCAGFSIRTTLKLHDKDIIDLPHTSYRELLKKYRKEIENYTIFTVVRNTYGRLLSLYLYIDKFKKLPQFQSPFYDDLFKKSFIDFLKDERVNEEFTINQNCGDLHYCKYIGQIEWIIDESGVIPENINIIKYSNNLEKDINLLLFKKNLKISLPNLNNTSHSHYSNYYNDNTITLINTKFKKEINEFNFGF